MSSALQFTDTRVLRAMADTCLVDAKALFNHNKEEAMRLFRLAHCCLTEIHRRKNPAICHQFN